MSFFKRILLVLMVVLAAYVFWPRSSSLTAFDPSAIAELQVKAWSQAGARQWAGHAATTYRIFESQYRLPPVSALKAAIEVSRAAAILRSAADAADRESAAKPLTSAYATLKARSRGQFDPAAVAAQEIQAVGLMLEGRTESAAQAFAAQYALLYGGTPGAYLPAARGFVRAGDDALAGDWTATGASLRKAWTELHAAAGN